MHTDELNKKLSKRLAQVVPVVSQQEETVSEEAPTEGNGNLFDQIEASVRSAKISAGKAKLEGADMSSILLELDRIASISNQVRRLYG